MASPMKTSHQVPQFLLSSSNYFKSTNRTGVNGPFNRAPVYRGLVCLAAESGSGSAEPPKEKPKVLPKKPVYSMKKGQIVRVDKEKYLSSINYLSVDHPPYYLGLDYIYENRGEVVDIRYFETGECALAPTGLIVNSKDLPNKIAWVGIPTPPAWLPTDMLIKSDSLEYERI